ncbi:phosphopentomutase [Vallitaleaceae bacterium 9-2]
MGKRVIWIILDSVGIGELPDADKFGDVGSHTLCNTVNATSITLPNLEKLGIGHIEGVNCLHKVQNPIGSFGRCNEKSNGKDTTVGHWEMAGVHSPNPLPTYPNGFPDEIMIPFSEKTGRKWLANKPASGTDILDELGEEHMKTGALIVYTSADSVFQIAAHEEVVPIDELYRYCQIARELLAGEHGVARVIARPFIGKPGAFERTANRRDFSLSPPGVTVLDQVKKAGLSMVAVGKIEDIFNGKGVTEAIHTKDNMDGVDQTLHYMKSVEEGLIYTNLVQFDSHWGHRNDVIGYANGLVEFDNRLPEIIHSMHDEDILVINADHGCDPTTPSTDHSREYIPLLVYGKQIKAGIDLGTRETFADIGQSIADLIGVDPITEGISFKKELM